ncbi:MAG: SDR family NAD(P)-dependent oxidoreductase [Propionibacteriaceae bacterium]|nr:SDR family NAD(P)-dependent oxidoreductase [Propionibacteriaceae bacterium]
MNDRTIDSRTDGTGLSGGQASDSGEEAGAKGWYPDRKGKFRDKVVAITGAGSGIGRALAINLARRGARLSLSDYDPEGLAETVRLVGLSSTYSQVVDVTKQEQVADWADQTMAQFGVVHQIYNIAGITKVNEGLPDTTYEEIARVLNVNLWGVIYGTLEFLPHIIESGDGHVINMSSILGYMALPGAGGYVTSKFAVRGFSETLRTEMLLVKFPVKITVVFPSGVKTGIARSAAEESNNALEESLRVYEKKIEKMTTEQCADVILKGVARGKSRVRMEQAVWMDWVVRLFPQTYPWFVSTWSRHTFKFTMLDESEVAPQEEVQTEVSKS